MKQFILALMLAALSIPLSAQQTVVTVGATLPITDDITFNGDVITLTIPPGRGYASIGVDASGTWVGTIAVQCAARAVAGTSSLQALILSPRNSATSVTSFTANGQWLGTIAGCQRVIATSTAWTSGTATVTLVATAVGGSGGGGGGSGGSVTQGTDPWIVAGAGTAGVPGTAVLTVQGINSGTRVNTSEGSTFVDDSAFTANSSQGTVVMGRRIDVGGALENEDVGPLRLDANGNLMAIGNVASAATDSGNPLKVGGKYNSTLPTFTDGQRGDIQLNAKGGLLSQLMQPDGTAVTLANDPCGSTTKTSVPIDTASSGNVQLVALSGSTVIYVCAVDFTAEATVDVQLIYGTGSACATGETDLTAPYALSTTTGLLGINKGSGGYYVYKTAAGNALCIELGGAVQVNGSVTYVQQ